MLTEPHLASWLHLPALDLIAQVLEERDPTLRGKMQSSAKAWKANGFPPS